MSSHLDSQFKAGDVIVEIDPRYFRPTEVEYLLADPSKASTELKWKPKVMFEELVKIMVDADMESAGINPPGEGEQILKDKQILWTINKIKAR